MQHITDFATYDIKTGKLTHADIGQMQLYINYYDNEIATTGDNPTIGLILYAEKNEAMVKYTLGEKVKRMLVNINFIFLQKKNLLQN